MASYKDQLYIYPFQKEREREELLGASVIFPAHLHAHDYVSVLRIPVIQFLFFLRLNELARKATFMV